MITRDIYGKSGFTKLSKAVLSGGGLSTANHKSYSS